MTTSRRKFLRYPVAIGAAILLSSSAYAQLCTDAPAVSPSAKLHTLPSFVGSADIQADSGLLVAQALLGRASEAASAAPTSPDSAQKAPASTHLDALLLSALGSTQLPAESEETPSADPQLLASSAPVTHARSQPASD